MYLIYLNTQIYAESKTHLIGGHVGFDDVINPRNTVVSRLRDFNFSPHFDYNLDNCVQMVSKRMTRGKRHEYCHFIGWSKVDTLDSVHSPKYMLL